MTRAFRCDLSLENLRALKKAGHRYDYALFSGLGHNNIPHTLSSRHRRDASPPGEPPDSLASKVDAGVDLLMRRSLLR